MAIIPRERAAAVALASILTAAVASTGCKGGAGGGPALTKKTEDDTSLAYGDVPVPPADGPRLASIAHATPIYARPSTSAPELGHLHAGATVARSAEALTREGCAGGWYAIRPRGFVCAEKSATLDLHHPTLAAMALQPKLDDPLPYTYARTVKDTTLFGLDPEKDDRVVAIGKLPAQSGLAIVGSWTALDPEGASQRLAMLTSGHFVPAADLRQARTSTFTGLELAPDAGLPVSFVVKRGVRKWKLEGGNTERGDTLPFHAAFTLTGRFRTIDGVQFWAGDKDEWVRHQDVTTLRRRDDFPDFVQPDQRWMDLSIITGSLVLYEGKRAVFATLVSVGRDRLGDPKETASTARGTFEVVEKHITGSRLDPMELSDNAQIRDVPWVLKLSSGQYLHGTYWHDRFGIEQGKGHIALSPADARRVWLWATPALPEGWHGVTARPADAPKTLIHIRK